MPGYGYLPIAQRIVVSTIFERSRDDGRKTAVEGPRAAAAYATSETGRVASEQAYVVARALAGRRTGHWSRSSVASPRGLS